MIGSVKWFDAAKGFGFISGEDATEYFCHFRSIVEDGFKTLAPGEPVSFTVEHTLKGYMAVDVVRGGSKP